MGESSFQEKLLEHLDHVRLGKKSTSLGGSEIHCHNKRQAEELKSQALKALKLTDRTLKAMPKGCIEKQVLAWYLHTRTSVPNEWLSRQIHSGHPGNISKYTKAVATTKKQTDDNFGKKNT